MVFHPEPGVGPREVPDDEGSAWCEQATDGDVHLIGDVRGRNQVPEGVVLRAMICTGMHKEGYRFLGGGSAPRIPGGIPPG